jgi:apolipoprotein N-acyltransferase
MRATAAPGGAAWARSPPALAAAGAAMTPAFVATALWPLVLAAIALLVFAVARAASPARAALAAFAFGTGWLAAGTWWLFVSMHRYGGLPAWLAALSVLALAAALSVYLAAAGYAFRRWARPAGEHAAGGLPPAAGAALFAACWLLAELARGSWFTGFPWVASGYAFVDSPLAPLAPWVGVHGIGAVAAFAAAWLALAVAGASGRRARLRAAIAPLLVLAAPLALAPIGFTQATGTLRVALLQTHVAQDQKFAAERLPATLAQLAEALKTPAEGLVVAPETAVPLLPSQLEAFAPGWWAAVEAHFATPGRAALIGVPLGDFERGYTNSVVGLPPASSGAPPYRYDKHHLVPFGEFVPPGFRWFVRMMDIPLGDFTPGPADAPSFAFAGERLAPNICYEDLFGEELARRFADPARAPTVMVNVSNIAWFGDTVALPQHLNISRLRAIEFERPMLRATNTGATAIVDHRGRVTAALPPLVRGTLQGTVEGRAGLTPYARWAAHAGHWPLGLVAAALAISLATLAARWRTRGNGAAPPAA